MSCAAAGLTKPEHSTGVLYNPRLFAQQKQPQPSSVSSYSSEQWFLGRGKRFGKAGTVVAGFEQAISGLIVQRFADTATPQNSKYI